VLGAIFNRISAGKEEARTIKYMPLYFKQARPQQKAYAFLMECDAFKANHDDYAAPGTTNACHVTKGAPPAALQTVAPCTLLLA
jgi:hypothetical protein